MNAIVRNGAVAVCAAISMAACASSMPRAERLALYESHSGPAVNKIRYFVPQGWEEIDDNHILLTIRPSEAYLLTLSGPCMDYDQGSPGLLITNTGGWVSQKFDRVGFGHGPYCRIEQIRPVDVAALRATRETM